MDFEEIISEIDRSDKEFLKQDAKDNKIAIILITLFILINGIIFSLTL